MTATVVLDKINSQLAALIKPIDILWHDPKNVKKHPKSQIAFLQESLKEFGQQKPVVGLKNGMVIAGNGTLRAAKEMGWTQLAVVQFDEEDKARAYALADNRIADLAEYDSQLVAEAIEASQRSIEGFNPAMVGFTEVEAMKVVASLHVEQVIVEMEQPDQQEAKAGSESSVQEQASSLSQVRMVQLFLNKETEPKLTMMLKELASEYSTTNKTDTVFEAVQREYVRFVENKGK